MEQLERTDSRMVAEKIREITGKKRTTRSTIIKDKRGNILTERQEVLQRWEEYVGELYSDDRGDRPDFGEIEPGPPILKDEVKKAVKSMKWKKAEGSDGIVVEMIEAAGEFAISKITELANKIYSTGGIPERMKESEFIVIPKQEGAVECGKHRTISIMSQVAKIVLKVINERLKRKVEETVDGAQFGFRKNRGTRNAIFVLRRVIERGIEKRKKIFMCFIDFEKAFDLVRHEKLMDRLRKLGVDLADVRVIANLYWGQKAVVRIGEEKSAWIPIERGVRQGCVLSPALFLLYSQVVMDELENLEGIKVGGININNIRYADDTVLMADSEEKLQTLVDKLAVECNAVGLRINIGKTETMIVNKKKEEMSVEINIQNQAVKQVRSFKYLGSLVDEGGRCDGEIRARIAMAKANFGKMRGILTNLSLSKSIRFRIVKTYIWSVMLYGCESWTIGKEGMKRLEAAEMWFIRRMMRVPWTARKTNEEVLQMAGVGRELLTVIRRRQLRYLGHILRGKGLEKECLLGMIEGKRERGRQRKTYMDDIKELLRYKDIGQLLRMTENRELWRSIIANVNIDTALR
jgi:hypothetical protein